MSITHRIPCSSLTCLIRNPEVLSHTAGFEEVLWNFAHFEDNRRITLQDNPHFYSELPTSSDAYTDQFKALPVENVEMTPNATIYVLVDQPRRVFLETRRETRIFGNVFTLKDVMIFKGLSDVTSFLYVAFNISLDIHGVLQGESVVGESIRGIPNVWRSEKLFVIPDPSTLAYDLRLWPIITDNPSAKRTSKDRKDLIRRALGYGDNDVHIYARQLPPLWTARKRVRHDESNPRILRIAHPSIPSGTGPATFSADIRATRVRLTVHDPRYAHQQYTPCNIRLLSAG